MAFNANVRRVEIRTEKHDFKFAIFLDASKFQSHFLKHCVFASNFGKEEWIEPANPVLTDRKELKERLHSFGCPVVCADEPHDWDEEDNPCGGCTKRQGCFDHMRDGLDAYVQAAVTCIHETFDSPTVRHAHILVGDQSQVVCLSDGFVRVVAMTTPSGLYNVQTCHSVLDVRPLSDMLLKNKRILNVMKYRRKISDGTRGKLIKLCNEERWSPTW